MAFRWRADDGPLKKGIWILSLPSSTEKSCQSWSRLTPYTGCVHGGGTHNIFRRRLVCHMICLQTMKPNLSTCIKREHLLSIYLHPDTRILYHEISNLAQERKKKAEMSLCKCGISIEPSHGMDVDESSEFWHLDKINIVDGSSLRCRWSYTINSYDFNPNCYDFNSNY